MLSIRLDKKTEEQLNKLTEAAQHPKNFFVRKALGNYLEDMMDYYEVQKRIADPKRNFISLETLEKALYRSHMKSSKKKI